jgi:hypothetical protein
MTYHLAFEPFAIHDGHFVAIIEAIRIVLR